MSDKSPKFFIALFLSFVFSVSAVYAGLHFGPVAGAKKKVQELKVKKEAEQNAVKPMLSWTGEPNYTNTGIYPSSGIPATKFVYRIKYADSTAGLLPAGGYPKVHIVSGGTDTAYQMTYEKGDVVSGRIYSFSISLPVNNDYTYYFEVMNSVGTVSKTSALSSPVVSSAATPPYLSWITDTGYDGNKGVYPESGTTATSFVYKVKYSDPGGNAPDFVKVNTGAATEDMTCETPGTGGYVSGVVCSLTKIFSVGGIYSYSFFAQNSAVPPVAATGAPLSAKSGPVVQGSLTGPALSWTDESSAYSNGGVSPTAGNISTTFAYRVRYTDTDNIAPSFVNLVVNKGTTTVYNGNITCPTASSYLPPTGIICHYSAQLGQGDYTYLFSAKNQNSVDAGGEAAGIVKTGPSVSSISTDPTLTYSNDEGYDGVRGVSPTTGSTMQNFIYKVVYSGPTLAADNPRVQIYQGTTLLTDAKMLWDKNIGDSVQYYYDSGVDFFDTGTYSYKFSAKTLDDVSATGPAVNKLTGPTVSSIPYLEWLGTTNYVSDGVNPDSIGVNQNAYYRIKYFDPGNNAPAAGYPKVEIYRGNNLLTTLNTSGCTGTAYSTTGAVCTFPGYRATDDGTDYNYRFIGRNSAGIDSLPAPLTGTKAGPNVYDYPSLTSPSVTPTSGTTGTTYKYRVTYKDPYGLAPSYVRANLATTSTGTFVTHSMVKISGDYPTGAVYQYATSSLIPGTDHTYYFTAANSVNLADQTAKINAPDVASQPVLSAGSVAPTSGDVQTSFKYTVTYKDPAGLAPSYVKVATGLATKTMTCATGNYVTGVVCTFTGYQFSSATQTKTYSYTFSAANSAGTTATNITGSGPLITIPAAPVLSNGTVNPTSGDTDTDFTFSVKYTDSGNNAPKQVRVTTQPDNVYLDLTCSGTTYTSGVTCSKSRKFSTAQTYSYTFSATSVKNAAAATITKTGLVVTQAPVKPYFTWIPEKVGFENDGINPNTFSISGNASDPFVRYKVKYFHSEGKAPASGYPKVNIFKGTENLCSRPGFTCTMAIESGTDFKTGVIYTTRNGFDEEFIGASLSYRFEAKDTDGNLATGTPTTGHSGPVVVP